MGDNCQNLKWREGKLKFMSKNPYLFGKFRAMEREGKGNSVCCCRVEARGGMGDRAKVEGK